MEVWSEAFVPRLKTAVGSGAGNRMVWAVCVGYLLGFRNTFFHFSALRIQTGINKSFAAIAPGAVRSTGATTETSRLSKSFAHSLHATL